MPIANPQPLADRPRSQRQTTSWRAIAITIGMLAITGVTAYLAAGTSWQIYADVQAVASLAMLATYGDWRILALAAAVMAAEPAAISQFAVYASGSPQPAWPWLPRAALLLITTCLAISSMLRAMRSVRAASEELMAAKAAAARQENALRLTSEVATDLAAQAAEDRLAREFEQRVGGLVADAAGAAQNVLHAAEQFSTVAEDAAVRTSAIADASQQTVASAQKVATSVDHLAASITRVTDEIREVSEVAFRSMDDAGNANATVQHLSDAATRIGDIIRVINRIAARTNLLALNATIEAARAGEAGRGFSVVANEVKQLAVQTAAATSSIAREIETIRTEMTHAMAAIDGMAGTVANLGGITVSVSGSMAEQADIARDIAASALRAAAGTESVVSNLQILTEQAAHGGEAAREGTKNAHELAAKCGAVQNAVHDFVAALLAA